MSPNELTTETNKRIQQIFLLAMIVTQLIYGSITLLSGCDTLPRTSEGSSAMLHYATCKLSGIADKNIFVAFSCYSLSVNLEHSKLSMQQLPLHAEELLLPAVAIVHL
jgi:hypothetical protein